MKRPVRWILAILSNALPLMGAMSTPVDYCCQIRAGTIVHNGTEYLFQSPTSKRLISFYTDSNNFLFRSADTEASLRSYDELGSDLRIWTKTVDGYWRYYWEAEGLSSVDLATLALPEYDIGSSTAFSFEHSSFLSEVAYLGIPDYWDPLVRTSGDCLNYSYTATNSVWSRRQTFQCVLSPTHTNVTAEIVYPDKTNEFRYLRKVTTFDSKGAQPVHLVCLNSPDGDVFEELYRIELLGTPKLRSAPHTVFSLSNYFIPGARAHTAHVNGQRLYTELPDTAKTSITIYGTKTDLRVVRGFLFGALALVAILCGLIIWKSR